MEELEDYDSDTNIETAPNFLPPDLKFPNMSYKEAFARCKQDFEEVHTFETRSALLISNLLQTLS